MGYFRSDLVERKKSKPGGDTWEVRDIFGVEGDREMFRNQVRACLEGQLQVPLGPVSLTCGPPVRPEPLQGLGISLLCVPWCPFVLPQGFLQSPEEPPSACRNVPILEAAPRPGGGSWWTKVPASLSWQGHSEVWSLRLLWG